MADLEIEREKPRAEIAAYLRKLADGLEDDSKITFIFGDESATINPPEQMLFKMKTGSDSSWIGGEHGRSFVLELGWETDEVEADQELTIVTQPKSQQRTGAEERPR